MAAVGGPCYCRGTRILTERGEIPVELLVIGETVVTRKNVARPIKWIGRRSYSGRFAQSGRVALPICIKANALDENLPRRDLWISPNHAMYLDGVLIEARDLVNGVSIVQPERLENVEYFHVELDSHDVIIAEGALSESFLDDDSRGMFHNAQGYYDLYPNGAVVLARYCAPRLSEGYEVEAIRRKIELRAGLRRLENSELGTLRGRIDTADQYRIAGWAQSVAFPEVPVCLDIYADGHLIGRVLANRYRADLQRDGLGSGRHSFEFALPVGLIIDTVEIKRGYDGIVLGQRKKLEKAFTSVA